MKDAGKEGEEAEAEEAHTCSQYARHSRLEDNTGNSGVTSIESSRQEGGAREVCCWAVRVSVVQTMIINARH